MSSARVVAVVAGAGPGGELLGQPDRGTGEARVGAGVLRRLAGDPVTGDPRIAPGAACDLRPVGEGRVDADRLAGRGQHIKLALDRVAVHVRVRVVPAVRLL